MILLYKPRFESSNLLFKRSLGYYLCISVKVNACGENIYFLNDKVI